MRRLIALIAGLLFLLLACPPGASAQEGAAAAETPHAFKLPASYLGELPCADCPSIRTIVSLARDSVFFLRRVYKEANKGKDKTVTSHGRWRVSEDGRVLYLFRGNRREASLSILGDPALRMRDQNDQEFASDANYTLKRMGGTDPIPDRLQLSGYYAIHPDSTGMYTDCDAGRSIPVAKEGARAELDKAYRGARGDPGEALLVTLAGKLQWQEDSDGRGGQRVLVVEKVDRFWRGFRCGDELPIFTLASGEWELVEMGGKIVSPPGGRDRPWMRFEVEEKRASGVGGCNRFSAGYEAEEDSLKFAPAVATKMACTEGMQTETDFFTMLASVTHFRVDGPVLVLHGPKGILAKMRLKG